MVNIRLYAFLNLIHLFLHSLYLFMYDIIIILHKLVDYSIGSELNNPVTG